ncbi:hypothetical protein GMLC_27980 [Geomonas limicola]|uniref:Uncharacterized protein n=1 Tax=Geomonas limicola TaxID=2740186 RepID=A0A6V8NDL6_9BACT|nr:hypothetical protein GMLC_27980 [Geomonas limicola]
MKSAQHRGMHKFKELLPEKNEANRNPYGEDGNNSEGQDNDIKRRLIVFRKWYGEFVMQGGDHGDNGDHRDIGGLNAKIIR